MLKLLLIKYLYFIAHINDKVQCNKVIVSRYDNIEKAVEINNKTSPATVASQRPPSRCQRTKHCPQFNALQSTSQYLVKLNNKHSLNALFSLSVTLLLLRLDSLTLLHFRGTEFEFQVIVLEEVYRNDLREIENGGKSELINLTKGIYQKGVIIFMDVVYQTKILYRTIIVITKKHTEQIFL